MGLFSDFWGEKTKAPASSNLWAQFFDDQGVRQRGQLCQMKNTRGFKGFAGGGFCWLALAQVACAHWIRWIPQKNPARPDRDSTTL
jgi:hypothetical protein